MQKFIFLIFLGVIAIVFAAPKPEKTCSPSMGLCHTTSDCCRNLICLTYAAKCVPYQGIIIPGKDTRPTAPPVQ